MASGVKKRIAGTRERFQSSNKAVPSDDYDRIKDQYANHVNRANQPPFKPAEKILPFRTHAGRTLLR